MIEHREFLIGGRMTAPSSNNVIDVISPHSEQIIGRTPDGAPADIDAAVAAARAAMAGEWGASSPTERVLMMTRLLTECRKRAEDFGIGREGGPEGLEAYLYTQSILGVLTVTAGGLDRPMRKLDESNVL